MPPNREQQVCRRFSQSNNVVGKIHQRVDRHPGRRAVTGKKATNLFDFDVEKTLTCGSFLDGGKPPLAPFRALFRTKHAIISAFPTRRKLASILIARRRQRPGSRPNFQIKGVR
jgi:hypothetical protein